MAPDPTFSSVVNPNPEVRATLRALAAQLPSAAGSLGLALDPDGDRLALIERQPEGDARYFTGNELGLLLAEHFAQHSQLQAVCTTIVSSPSLASWQQWRQTPVTFGPTGFRHLARLVPKQGFAFMFEEALGYAFGESMRDKDGVAAACAVAHMATHSPAGLLERLFELDRRIGRHRSAQSHVATTEAVVTRVDDRGHELNEAFSAVTGARVSGSKALREALTAAGSIRGWQWSFVDGTRITIRPSGTEPKVKVYVDVHEAAEDGESRRSAIQSERMLIQRAQQIADAAAAQLASG